MKLLEKDELIIKNAELAEKYSFLKTVNSKVVNGEGTSIGLKHRTVRFISFFFFEFNDLFKE
jgi:hypothetical protein